MSGFQWPSERGWLVIIVTALLVYVLTLLALFPALEKSQLFVALASGVVGASFMAVIGMWTSATKAGAELAQKAMDQRGSPNQKDPN
ncbi:hypothetical protein [Sphingomonas parapaucimobilis]|uniref:Uncharacterized protein n=1 Tax=Sphingomonas parapaucimobilis NBRC 15100 TaxID=1219049 RepID=A0A0A1W6E1_9SPHN|nr:hypothetical protein [Sphingomonas parapaucimobilis]GAM00701.1 hypothetical protein SP5_035_01010 [Sphingomonas parapaucimobilis NBRC 15100]